MAALPPPEGMTEDDYDSIHAAVVETVRGRWFLAEYARRSRVDEVQEMLAAIGRLEQIVTGSKVLPPPPPNDVSPHLRLLAQRVDDIARHLADITEDLRESGADPYLCDELETQVRAIAGLPRGAGPDAAPNSASSHLPAPQLAPSAAPERMIALEAPSSDRLEQDASREAHNAFPQPALDVQAVLTPEPPAGELRQKEVFQEEQRQDQVLKDDPSQDMSLGHEPLREVPFGEVPALPVMPVLPRVTPLRLSDPDSDPRPAALAALDRLSLAEKLALFS